MRLRRVALLVRKEFFQGPKNFFFLWALVAPVIISLAVTLVFGSLFSHKATLGVVDMGESQLVEILAGSPSLKSREYDSVPDLERAVEAGKLDGGIVLPADFDASLVTGERVHVDFYLWGQSLAKDRTVMAVTVNRAARDLAGQESPVVVETVSLGEQENIPWEDRLLPFIVLVTVFFAGIALSGTSLLKEKEKRTIDALMVTPTTIRELFLAKGLLGLFMSVLMGMVILAINQALGTQPALLLGIIVLGAVMATTFGLLFASLFKNTMTFFGNMKMIGLLLYAPVIIYLFPTLPQWIGKFFPTYYIVDPIVEISQRGGGWVEIAPEVFVLIALDAALIALLGFVIGHKRQYA